jgi:release factor glutamine methyltransferase
MTHKPIELAKKIADQLQPIYDLEQDREQVAWWLLQAIMKQDDAELVAQSTIDLTGEQEKKLADWLKKHVQEKMPLQYILGWVPFGPLKIKVQPPILIPRPETEEWSFRLAEELSALKNQSISILDLCTGTGCIALALAYTLPQARITATDINPTAIELAKQNAALNTIKNVTFLESDLFSAIPAQQQFDLIVANPPYVTNLEWSYLDPLVSNWEDRNALVADDEGLAIIKQIISNAKKYLKKNLAFANNDLPQLAIEIGYTQGNTVKMLLDTAGFNACKIESDLSGKDRLAIARL